MSRVYQRAAVVTWAIGMLWVPALWAAQTETGDGLMPAAESPATGTVPRSAYPKPTPQAGERHKAGIPFGSFLLLPRLSAQLGYDDNVFATPTNEEEDLLAVFSPGLKLTSNWRRNRLSVDMGSDIGRYRRFSSENYNDYYLDSSGRFALARRASLFGGAGYSYNHEPRTSPDAVNGSQPTIYTDTHAFAGAAFGMGRFDARVGASASRLNFSNVPSATGMINNDVRDRGVLQAGGRLSYSVSGRLHPFVQGNYDRRVYVLPTDLSGYRRSSAGFRLAGGLRFDLRPDVEGEVLAGYLYQRYDDPRFATFTAPDFGLRLAWRRSATSKLGVFADRRLEETTVTGSAGYLSTRVGLDMDRSLSARWSVNAHAALVNNDYENIARVDRVTDAGVGLRYDLTRHLTLEAEYRLLHRNSDDPTADYFSNQVFVSLSSRLYPLPSAPYTPLSERGGAAGEPGFAGPYFGVETGYGSLDSSLSGARGEGDETADYGNSGASQGLFAGYGWMFGRWYAGLEARAEFSNADWTHEKPGGRIFSVEQKQGYGVDGRVGYQLDSGALLFARVGGDWTGFESRYQLDSASPYVRADDTVFGRRYGLGADVPVSDHLFVRMAYTFSDFNHYSVDYGSGTETFDNSSGVFRVGLGWRLEGHETSTPAGVRARRRVGGFYGGLAAGYGVLNTPIHADQTQSSAPPTTLDADFSARGLTTNAFIGYGFTYRHLYMGIEADSDIGKADWAHTRQPGGRSFSVDKKGDQGVGLRLGWVLDNGTLFYAYAGKVRTKFHTTYVKGNNASYWVSRDDEETGNRYGVGVELPLSDAFFLRLDYTYTHYDPYGFTTGQAYSDTVRFDNNETMFKLGLGFRL